MIWNGWKKRLPSSVAVGVVCCALFAAAQSTPAMHQEKLLELVESDSFNWASSAIVVDSVMEQNLRNHDVPLGRITVMEERWKSELNRSEQPLIRQIMSHPLSVYLQLVKAESDGLFTEIIVLDEQAITVGRTSKGGVFWFDDSKAWKETLGRSNRDAYVEAAAYSPATEKFQATIAKAIEFEGQLIGVVLLGVNIDKLLQEKSG